MGSFVVFFDRYAAVRMPVNLVWHLRSWVAATAMAPNASPHVGEDGVEFTLSRAGNTTLVPWMLRH